jgi:hypothetical protein
MGWIEDISFGFDCPYFADVFEGCEALECLQPPAIIVGVDKIVEVGFELFVAIVMIAFDPRLREDKPW